SDDIPAGMTFASETHDPAFSCSTPPVGMGGTITCTAPLLTAETTANFTFVLTIDPGTPDGTIFVNQATGTSQTFDPDEENSTGIAVTSTPPPPLADMGVIKDGPS